MRGQKVLGKPKGFLYISMTMIWTKSKINELRRRLGWSQAELSRRVGVSVDVLRTWETGAARPDSEACIQLSSLEGHMNHYSKSLATDPVAETFLSKNRLNQIFKNDLKSE